MEILTFVLAGLLSAGSSGGTVLELLAQNRLRSQVISIEQQAIRIDNLPNYRIASGKIDRVRVATRGVKIKPNLRIDTLELETDPILLKLGDLSLNSLSDLRKSLTKPVSGALKVVVTEADLNQALQSPEIIDQLQETLNLLISRKAGSTNIAYQLSNLQVNFYPSNVLEVSFALNRPRPSVKNNLDDDLSSKPGTSESNKRSRELNISLSLGIEVINGKKISIINPQGTVNGSPMSTRLLQGFATGISDRFDLNSFSTDGILTRILQLEIDEDKLQLVNFLRLETKMP